MVIDRKQKRILELKEMERQLKGGSSSHSIDEERNILSDYITNELQGLRVHINNNENNNNENNGQSNENHSNSNENTSNVSSTEGHGVYL